MRTGPLAAMFAAYHARRRDAPPLEATIERADSRRDHGDGEPHAADAFRHDATARPGFLTRVTTTPATIIGDWTIPGY